MSTIPPLLPKVDAILVLDGDGNRLAGKYYGDFLKKPVGDQMPEALRSSFEKALQQKIGGMAARPEAAEVVTCQGRTAVFCGGGAAGSGGASHEVRVVHVGPMTESELVLAYLCEGMYDALQQLMGGSTDRSMILDNLELVFLLIDEHCDGGIVLEVDGTKLAGAVLLRDDDAHHHGAGDDHGHHGPGHHKGAGGPVAPGMPQGAGDLTIGQALEVARRQFMANMTSRDGM
ncbi:hypothetical protein ACA910_004469 [Epithemia clementina (nom. ined.)]